MGRLPEPRRAHLLDLAPGRRYAPAAVHKALLEPASCALALAAAVGILAGCSPAPTTPPAANAAPFARFAAPARVADGTEARFDATSSFDPDGTLVSYRFTFGDGTPDAVSAGPEATHVFHGPGDYPVHLTVTDDAGATGEALHTVHVSLAAPAACDDADPCPLTQVCDTGTCYNTGPGDACASDADCTAQGTGCYGGACVPPECQVDADCGTGAECRGGLCQPLPAFDGGTGGDAGPGGGAVDAGTGGATDGGTADGGMTDGGMMDGGMMGDGG